MHSGQGIQGYYWACYYMRVSSYFLKRQSENEQWNCNVLFPLKQPHKRYLVSHMSPSRELYYCIQLFLIRSTKEGFFQELENVTN